MTTTTTIITNLKLFNADFNKQVKVFSGLAKEFKAFRVRFGKMLMQKERNFEVRDTDLEKDFAIFTLNLQKFSFTIYQEVQKLRFSCVRLFPKEEILTLKELISASLAFNTQVKNFDNVFKELDQQIPEISLNLKWGLVEIARNDFLNLEKQLLSLIKEAKKYYV